MKNLENIDNVIVAVCIMAVSALLILLALSRKKVAKLSIILSQYKKEAEGYDELNQRIFVTIRHDIGSVVNSLTSFNRLLDYDDLSVDDVTIYTDDLKRVIRENTFLMRNLFYWGSIQTEEFQPYVEEFDIGFLVKDAIRSLATASARKNVTLHSSIPENTVIKADMNMVRQVVDNVIQNAVKYSYSGSSVEISSKVDRETACLVVKDLGAGMSPGLVMRLNAGHGLSFLKKVPGTMDERGTGIGLSVCKSLLKRMGAAMYVESSEGRGTTVSLVFKNAEEYDDRD